MEDGTNKKRNVRPVEKSKLPFVTLLILAGLVVALLYAGYEYLRDDSGGTKELTDVAPDTSKEVVELDVYSQPSLVEPEPVQEETGAAAPVSVGAGEESYTHTIKSGDTFFSIGARYNLKPETVKSLNPSVSEPRAGQKLTVPIQAIHTVGAGDILRVVAGKYGITVDQLMKANGKTRNHAARGEKLVIPLKEKR